jgi:hypothetical protein
VDILLELLKCGLLTQQSPEKKQHEDRSKCGWIVTRGLWEKSDIGGNELPRQLGPQTPSGSEVFAEREWLSESNPDNCIGTPDKVERGKWLTLYPFFASSGFTFMLTLRPCTNLARR